MRQVPLSKDTLCIYVYGHFHILGMIYADRKTAKSEFSPIYTIFLLATSVTDGKFLLKCELVTENGEVVRVWCVSAYLKVFWFFWAERGGKIKETL